MSSLLMDSGGRVNIGGQGGFNATSNISAPGLTMSVLLSPATAPAGNQAPTANASQVSCTELTCSFDGGSSTDPDADQLTYDWNWGDGTAHGTTATPSHTFTSGGDKTVTLTVSDPLGATGTTTVTATPTAPANRAPTATITNAGCTDLACSFDGSTSSDPDPDTLTYSWDFGDATAAATTANPSHTYTTAGEKTVTLTVSDGNGLSDTDTVTVNPTDPPPNLAPTAAITDASCTDLSCSFKGSTSTDPEGDTLTYSWDFGDTTAAAATADPSHTYTTAGEKTVTLTVDDGHGNTDTDTVTVSPTNPPNTAPTARITGATCTDLTCSFSGTTSTDPDNDPLSYSWDFGDTTPAGSGATPSHDYATAGAKTVTLTVDDGNGHTATDTVTANPTDPQPDPVSNVAFVGANSSNGNRLNHSTTLPDAVNVGDTLVAFFTANSTAQTYAGPVGWTLLETRDGNAIVARAWTKTATAADAALNARVTVTSSGYVKSDLTVAAYRNTDGTTPIAVSASRTDNVAGATHVSPAVTATDDTSWLVSYWADKSDSTTGWTAPAGQTVRRAAPTAVGTSHITALLTDGNGPVSSGANGQLTATANSTSSRGASFSILLKSS
jgi:PKD repeat protein